MAKPSPKSKRISASRRKLKPLSPLAEVLLARMAEQPQTIEYHWRILGSGFQDESIDMLDAAYQELVDRNLVESARAIYSWFGVPKGLYRINDRGLRFLRERAA